MGEKGSLSRLATVPRRFVVDLAGFGFGLWDWTAGNGRAPGSADFQVFHRSAGPGRAVWASGSGCPWVHWVGRRASCCCFAASAAAKMEDREGTSTKVTGGPAPRSGRCCCCAFRRVLKCRPRASPPWDMEKWNCQCHARFLPCPDSRRDTFNSGFAIDD